MEKIESSKVRRLADEIVQLINERQYRALKQLNSETIELWKNAATILSVSSTFEWLNAMAGQND